MYQKRIDTAFALDGSLTFFTLYRTQATSLKYPFCIFVAHVYQTGDGTAGTDIFWNVCQNDSFTGFLILFGREKTIRNPAREGKSHRL